MTELNRPLPTDPPLDAPSNGAVIPLARPVTVDGRPWLISSEPATSAALDDPMLLREFDRGSAAVDVLALIAIVILGELLFGTVVQLIGAMPLEDASEEAWAAFRKSMLVPSLAFRTIVIAGAVWIILSLRRQTPKSVGLTARRLPVDILLGLGAMGVSFGLVFTYAVSVSVLFPSWLKEMEDNASLLTAMIPRMSIGAFGLLAMLIGFYEELLVRGFLMTRLRRLSGSWTAAVVVSTVLFVLPHAADQAAPVMGHVTILSLVFSVVTIWRRSLVPAMVGHAVFNFIQFIALGYQAGEEWQ